MGTSPVTLGSGGSAGTFLYTGAGGTTSRGFTLAGSGGVFPVATSLGISGVVGGNGSFTKTSSGTLTLSGGNLYTGPTNIASGVLAVSGSGAINYTSGVIVSQGATLQVTAGSSSQLPASGNITLNGGNLGYVGNGSVNPGQVAGGLVLNPGQNTVTTSNVAGSACYLQFASGPTSHTTGATVNFVPTSSYIQFQANPPAPSNGIIGGYAYYNGTDFATWNTSGPSGYPTVVATTYTTSDPGQSSSGTANFEPSSSFSTSAARTFNSLNLTGSNSVTITGGGSVGINCGGLIGNTTGTVSGGTLSAPNGELDVNTVQHLTVSSVVSTGTALVKTGSATLTLTSATPISGNTYLNQGTLEYNPSSNLTYGGVISGAGNLLKSGGATLTLTGANSYYGSTTVNGGALCVSGSLAAGTTVNVQSGATLTGGGTVGGNVIVSGGAIAQSAGGSITGTVTDTGGALTVGQSGVGNYLNTVGGVNVGGSGTLVAGTTAATITGSVNYTSSSNSTFSGVVTGNSSVVTLGPGAGTLMLSSADQYGGGSVVQGGTLKVGNASALGSGSLTLSGGELDLDGFNVAIPTLSGAGGTVMTSTGSPTLTVNGSGSGSYYGSITGSGLNLVKSGGGMLILDGSNSYTGGTTVTGGLLEIASAGSLPSGTRLTIGTGAGVVFDAGIAGIGAGDASVSGQTAQAMASSAAPVAGGSNLDSGTTTPVPEPGTLASVLAAALGLGLSQLRRKAER
jgi:autotransporter-associated beta strand protein